MTNDSDTGVAEQDAGAALGLSPELKAASLIATVKPYSRIDEKQIIQEVKRQIAAVRSGDVSRSEGLLVGQAEVLDVLFYSLLSQSLRAEDREASAALLSMALQAQEGCRSAIEGLAAIKK